MRKVTFTVSILLSIILCAMGFFSCFSGKIQLYAPENLQIIGKTLTWDEVENASGYKVYLEDKANETQKTSFLLPDLTGPATYRIEILAVGDGKKYTNSPRNYITYIVESSEDPIVEVGYDERGFKYTLLEDGTGYEVHRGKVDFNSETLRGEVYFPDFFNGYPVKRIAESAFSVRTLDSANPWAHPNPIAKVNCNTVTTSFRLPAYLESIGRYAFYGCVEVEEFVLPESVTQIDWHAFNSCGSLKRITLPTGLKEIPNGCFEDCALEEIILPERLERIGNGAFNTSLHPDYSVSSDYKARTNQWFTKIVIPDSVTDIGQHVFQGCVKLEEVILPAGLQAIPAQTFQNCYSLQHIDIPDSVTEIGGWLAFGATAIESIVIPAGIIKLGSYIFTGTPLREIYYKGTQEQWEGIEIDMGKNSEIDEATKYFYSETKPTVEGNYWHYVNGEVVVW